MSSEKMHGHWDMKKTSFSLSCIFQSPDHGMSLGGSLMTNQDATPSKNGKKVQITPSTSRPGPPKTLETSPTPNGGVVGNPIHGRPRRKKSCLRSHLNSLWSLWYGLLVTGLNVYIALQCTKRFLDYIELAWPISLTPPKSELHAYIILTGEFDDFFHGPLSK